MSGRYRIGVDVGGTFTDCVLLRPDGSILLEKTPTTPDDQSDGVLAGIGRLAEAEKLTDVTALLGQCESIVHGTTAADNTLIQMTGAPTGLLVTEGFRDEIEMRRCFKEDIWDPGYPAPEPIARRRVRLEIAERVTSEGTVDLELDEPGVRKATARLRAFGVTSIAVCFLHSYLNPTHERRARELIVEEYPDVELVSLSHEVWPKPPEFERTSTTLVNVFVGPPIVRYLERLESRLTEAGFGEELLLATSSGGVATPRATRTRPLATIGSGPTGGVVAAARASATAGLGDVVSVDMGGTSYDVCLIRDGRPEVKTDWNWRHRYCIALPMVDVHSIGAGGGSLSRHRAGTLTVGPESAGSIPGPVCYRRGGTEPTVTDADLVLGRLDPDAFWSGRLALDIDGARKALATVGEPLGLDAEAAAVATVAIIDAHMCDAVRRILSLAGADPRSSTWLPSVAWAPCTPSATPHCSACVASSSPELPQPFRPSACSRPTTWSMMPARSRVTGGRSTSGRSAGWRKSSLPPRRALSRPRESPPNAGCSNGDSTWCTRGRPSMWPFPSTCRSGNP